LTSASSGESRNEVVLTWKGLAMVGGVAIVFLLLVVVISFVAR
jgi:hypothetical protein